MSAKIYQFPARGPFVPAPGQVVSGEPQQDSAAVDFLPQRGAKVLSSSAWYHEDAVDADRTDH